MTFKPARLLLALIAVVAIPAFAQNVAVVNGKAIPSSRVDAVVKQVIAQGQQQDSPQLRDAVKKDLIAREVMMQEAVKQGFEKDATVKSQMEYGAPDHRHQRPGPRFHHQEPGQGRRHQG